MPDIATLAFASNHIKTKNESPPEQQSQVVAPCRLPPSGRHVRMHSEYPTDAEADERWQQESD